MVHSDATTKIIIFEYARLGIIIVIRLEFHIITDKNNNDRAEKTLTKYITGNSIFRQSDLRFLLNVFIISFSFYLNYQHANTTNRQQHMLAAVTPDARL